MDSARDYEISPRVGEGRGGLGRVGSGRDTRLPGPKKSRLVSGWVAEVYPATTGGWLLWVAPCWAAWARGPVAAAGWTLLRGGHGVRLRHERLQNLRAREGVAAPAGERNDQCTAHQPAEDAQQQARGEHVAERERHHVRDGH
eukprot:7608740-Pyramimonas_sp.AAC.1